MLETFISKGKSTDKNKIMQVFKAHQSFGFLFIRGQTSLNTVYAAVLSSLGFQHD